MNGTRCRWKIENETFNMLKTGGYELEHSFGHGREGFFVTLCIKREKLQDNRVVCFFE